jgi:hypothetical protein
MRISCRFGIYVPIQLRQNGSLQNGTELIFEWQADSIISVPSKV